MGPEERKVSSRVHTDALKPFHPHVGKLLCWSYIKLLKANKTTLLGSLKVYFYLMMTFALGVRYSSRKPTRAASMEQILKRTKELLFLFKSSILVNVRPIAVINERVMSQHTRGGWNSTAVWNTILTFQSLFKTRVASPAQSGFAKGRHTKYCSGQLCRFCCLGQHFHNEQWVTNCVSHSLPFPGAWSSGSPSLPILSHQPGCHAGGAGSPFPPAWLDAGGAGSPSLSQMVLTVPSKTPTWPEGPCAAPLNSRGAGDWEKLGVAMDD